MSTYKSPMGWTFSVRDVGEGPFGKYRWEVKKGIVILTGSANTEEKALQDGKKAAKLLLEEA